MEKKDLIIGVVGLTVCVIVAATVLMPILSDATKTTDTYTNEGYFRASQYDTTTNHTLTWSYESPNVVVVDGADVTLDYHVKNGGVTVVADTNWIVRMFTDSNGDVANLALLLSSGGTTLATVANSDTVSMSFESGTMSCTFGATSKTAPYTDLYLPSTNGAFIMKNADIDAYINSDSTVVAYGLSRVKTHSGSPSPSPGVGIYLSGSIDDGITGIVWRGDSVCSLSDEEINATSINDHIDLYKLSSLTATASFEETIDEVDYVTDSTVTYNYLLVPYQVTAERSVHFDSGTNAIINAIPIIIIVAMITMAVGFFLVKRE